MTDWRRDKVSRLAAALSYYTVFSLAPLLIVVIAIAGLAFGREAAHGQIVAEIRGVVGQDAAEMIQRMIESASQPRTGIVASAVGIGTLLLGAAGVFGQLQDALNTIWDAPPRRGAGVMRVVRDRFLSFLLLVGTGFLLLISLVLSAVPAAIATFRDGWLPVSPWMLESINGTFSFAVITVLFAVLFKVLPDVQIPWRDVWIGAAITALLFLVGKSLLGFYLGRSALTSTFGAAGSLVIILLWVYYSAQIVLFGAEFTQVYSRWLARKAQERAGRPHARITGGEPTQPAPAMAPAAATRPATVQAAAPTAVHPSPAPLRAEVTGMIGILVGIVIGLGGLLQAMRAGPTGVAPLRRGSQPRRRTAEGSGAGPDR